MVPVTLVQGEDQNHAERKKIQKQVPKTRRPLSWLDKRQELLKNDSFMPQDSWLVEVLPQDLKVKETTCVGDPFG